MNELFVYTTVNHFKYYLPSGNTITIRTLDFPIYVQSIVKDQLFCLDSEARAKIVDIDTTEARFKLGRRNTVRLCI